MSVTLDIFRQRRKRQAASRRSTDQQIKRASLGCGFLLSLLMALVILAGALSYASLTHDLPPIENIPLLLNPPAGLLLQPTRIYDRSGQYLLQTLSPSDALRRYIPLASQNPQHLPEALAQATIVVADPGFWDHPGFSLEGLADPENHPTLAQRLVFELLLWDEPASLRRALRERILAAQVTAQYGRSQVLEWALNNINYGHYAYGAEAAAQLYLGKSVTRLDLADCALLAGIGGTPDLNPIDAPQAAFQRRQEVIHVMQALEVISSEDAGQALAAPANFLSAPETPVDPFSAFTGLVLSQLSNLYDRSRLERGGLTILSTLDFDLQLQAVCAVQSQLERLAGGAASEGYAAAVPCEAARLLPTLPSVVPIPGIAASTLLLDPQMGQVLAFVVEPTRAGSQFLASHPVGTLLTPLIYLTGFTRGLSPASLVWDVSGGSDIRNPDGENHGPVRLRLALANDYLVSAAQVLDQIGSENVNRTTASFGLNLSPSINLLKDEIPLTLLDVARVYQIFAAQGVMVGQDLKDEILQPVAVLKVTGADNVTWLDWNTPQTRAVVTTQLAYLMNHVLSDATARWPGMGTANPLEVGRPAGAKLGLTNMGSTWTVGYTPRRVAVVWMGAQDQRSTPSPRSVAGLWHALIQYASRDLPPDGWSKPAGITSMKVCDPSGLLPTDECPNVVNEVFLNGNEPVQLDNLYQLVQINRETGYLATVFTPPELIDDRIYMMVPPEAKSWAEAAGLPTPPDAYDAIQPSPLNPAAQITEPTMFADLRGKVQITGTASGNDFVYYRVQFGQGLNPQAWIQVGEDVRSPLEAGVLMEWDTSGLNGLYAVRLLVVRADQRLDMATVQVNVDNDLPQVNVLFPRSGQKLDDVVDQYLAFQVNAGDQWSPLMLDFYVDGQLIGSVGKPPFILSWFASLGNHTLRVVASDRAGNQTEELVNFTILS